jgi:predicted metal-dependent phosphoesterase TrpH
MTESLTLRVDLHTHTHYSADAWTPPRLLLERCEEAGIDRVAITDHGEIEGALEARSLQPHRVIVGEEIMCSDATELIGLFLTERIPMGLPAQEVAERIRDQGGVVYAPHPFAYPTRAAAHAGTALAFGDLVEVFNSRAFLPTWNRRAVIAAGERGFPGFAGSDAHFPWEIGRAFTELPAFDSAAGLVQVAPLARPHGMRRASPFIHMASIGLRLARGCAPGLVHAPGRRPPVQPAA